jgi:hypothetical protein
MQWGAVMTFDVVETARAVRLAEVEVTDFARDGKAAASGLGEFPAAEPGITFTP